MAGFRQEFRRQRQVMLGGHNINMAEVCCELRQQALYVCSAAIPGDEAVNCNGVTIMPLAA